MVGRVLADRVGRWVGCDLVLRGRCGCSVCGWAGAASWDRVLYLLWIVDLERFFGGVPEV